VEIGSNVPFGLFVTATDTDAGKTAVAVAMVRHLRSIGRRVGVYKPAASGGDGDPRALWEAAGRPGRLADVCPQVFAAPIAPHHAARLEGRTVDEALLRRGIEPWLATADIVVVEGAGGLCSPLGDRADNAAVARDLGLPLVVVDAARLGAVGRTLATVRAARAENLVVAAIVLSHVAAPDGPEHDLRTTAGIARAAGEDLAARLPGVPVAVLRHGSDVIEPAIDWESLAAGL
jgi:dethiobiotin synthetase